MNKKRLSRILIIAGAALIATGIVLLKTIQDAQGMMLALPYLCIGLGSGLFGQGAGEIITRSIEKRNPEAARTMQIEKNDERNITVSNRAKAKALDLMIFVFGALNLSLALMGVDFRVVLLSVFAYVFVLVSALYYRIRFDKEM
ncbi:MAG TPA: hypothetical protein PKU80_12565 [Candidatus Limiplasma sp.]|nr:hypothetical protein [Candidatus Limiplasma sp.]